MQVSGRFQGQLFNPQNVVNNFNQYVWKCMSWRYQTVSEWFRKNSAFISLQCKQDLEEVKC